LYTLSKSEFSIFIDWTDLGSVKHQTLAEVEDAYELCKKATQDYNAKIASVPVDNAARGVATKVCDKLGHGALPSRDPAHCADLCSKDLAQTNVVKSVMAEAKEVRDFVKIDRIDSIRVESNAVKDADEYITTAVNMCETRMNLCHDFILAARKQHDFVKLLWGNESFRTYFNERSAKVQDATRAILDRCSDNSRWERMDVLLNSLLIHFKRVHGLCSREDFPLSCYVLLIQALRNEINRGLDARFDEVLGENSRREVADMIRERFNMDGMDTTGRKVGLLDRHHLMCFLVDPYSFELRSTFKLGTNLAPLVNEMIARYIPLDEDGSTASRERVKREFMVSFDFSVHGCIANLIQRIVPHLSLAFRSSTLIRESGSTPFLRCNLRRSVWRSWRRGTESSESRT
jgi:hypothetical protein